MTRILIIILWMVCSVDAADTNVSFFVKASRTVTNTTILNSDIAEPFGRRADAKVLTVGGAIRKISNGELWTEYSGPLSAFSRGTGRVTKDLLRTSVGRCSDTNTVIAILNTNHAATRARLGFEPVPVH